MGFGGARIDPHSGKIEGCGTPICIEGNSEDRAAYESRVAEGKYLENLLCNPEFRRDAIKKDRERVEGIMTNASNLMEDVVGADFYEEGFLGLARDLGASKEGLQAMEDYVASTKKQFDAWCILTKDLDINEV